jgi:hypothetical protein
MGAMMDGLDSLLVMLGQIRRADGQPHFGRQTHGKLRGRCRVTAYPYIFPAMKFLEEQGAVHIQRSVAASGRKTTVYFFTNKPIPPEDEILRAVMKAVREDRVSHLDDIYYPQPKEPEPEEAAPAA